MARERPEWHARAEELLAQGVPIKQIANHFRVTVTCAKWAVDYEGVRSKNLSRERTGATTHSGRKRAAGRSNPEPKEHGEDILPGHQATYLERRSQTPRKFTRILVDPETKMAACRAFAAGKIDRAQLMERITAWT